MVAMMAFTCLVVVESYMQWLIIKLSSNNLHILGASIADKESSYKQFRNFSLYGQAWLWPNESVKDGGSHIGLMQMPTLGAARIWDWVQNATDRAYTG